jgi:sec-independent protein translocase protein TatC
MTPPDDEPADPTSKPFLEHLQDLRQTILWCAGFLCAGMVVAIPLAPYILEALKGPLKSTGIDPETFLRVIKVAGGFSVALRVIFWSGLLLAVPGILFAVGRFVFPGLTPREQKAISRSLIFATFLFAAGVAMGYFMTLPVALKMMFRINSWIRVDCEFVELADYASFVLKLLIAFGLAFELPVIVLALGSLGIVTSRQLRDKRRHVVIALLVLAMFLTPQDPFTMVLMAAPLALLYEGCIWLIWFRERKEKAEAEARP